MVQVILRQAVDDLGDIGEVVDVKPGYARNFLIPQGMAYEATDANQKRFEEERRHILEIGRRASWTGPRRRRSASRANRLASRCGPGEEGKAFRLGDGFGHF